LAAETFNQWVSALAKGIATNLLQAQLSAFPSPLAQVAQSTHPDSIPDLSHKDVNEIVTWAREKTLSPQVAHTGYRRSTGITLIEMGVRILEGNCGTIPLGGRTPLRSITLPDAEEQDKTKTSK